MEKQFEVMPNLYATQGQRFANYIIDIIFSYILIIIVFFLLAFLSGLLGWFSILNWMENISDLEGYFVYFAIAIPYYSIFEATKGRTIGKLITKTIVVDEFGEKLSFSDSLKRTLCRFIPFEQFSFLNSDGRGWHDTISNTYVVNKKHLEEDKELFYSFNEIGKISENL